MASTTMGAHGSCAEARQPVARGSQALSAASCYGLRFAGTIRQGASTIWSAGGEVSACAFDGTRVSPRLHPIPSPQRVHCRDSDAQSSLIIGDLLFYEYPDNWLPEDHPWWLRKDGQRQQFWPGTHRMDWYNEEYRRHVVRQTVSLKEAGVDGVFYDNVRNEPAPWVAFLQAVRGRDDFLILVNAGYAVGE
jgi:hypothetical protein